MANVQIGQKVYIDVEDLDWSYYHVEFRTKDKVIRSIQQYSIEWTLKEAKELWPSRYG